MRFEPRYHHSGRAGLDVIICVIDGKPQAVIMADEVEAWLDRAPKVEVKHNDPRVAGWSGRWWVTTDAPNFTGTHTARLVLLEEIPKKSIEEQIMDVLRDHAIPANEALTQIRKIVREKAEGER